MRDITMQIPFSDGTTRTTTGKEVVPGLVVAPHHLGGWQLVHVRSVFGKDPVYLTRFGRPLSEVFGEVQGALFEDPAWHEDEGFRCGDRCDT